jgi:hypothetical protein
MASIFKRGRWVDGQGRKCSRETPGAKWAESKTYSVQLLVNGRPKLFKGYTDRQATEHL